MWANMMSQIGIGYYLAKFAAESLDLIIGQLCLSVLRQQRRARKQCVLHIIHPRGRGCDCRIKLLLHQNDLTLCGL